MSGMFKLTFRLPHKLMNMDLLFMQQPYTNMKTNVNTGVTTKMSSFPGL